MASNFENQKPDLSDQDLKMVSEIRDLFKQDAEYRLTWQALDMFKNSGYNFGDTGASVARLWVQSFLVYLNVKGYEIKKKEDPGV